ncbi:acyl-CoA thioesterase-1 [Constrictibacter sp. MBR-5]|jgi:acyl-CoA thioesterase-1|uniref:arylesterase n=1 Tax=Constrictibacter sp. MBR-5 TaxID=3156467 RepID=UPI0033967BE3
MPVFEAEPAFRAVSAPLSSLVRMGRAYGPVRGLFNLALLLPFAALLAWSQVASAAPTAPKLLLLGDSLTAGYGLPPAEGFVAQLRDGLRTRGLSPDVIDGGVSGDTTAGGLARIDWLLAEKPTHAVVSLGANDALRGLPPEQAYNNLDAMLTKLEQAGVEVLLTGMYAPPNLGADYGRAFSDIYKRLAEKHDVPLYPFFLDGVARDPALNQADGIHPNAKGVEIMVERLMPHVVSLLNGAAG